MTKQMGFIQNTKNQKMHINFLSNQSINSHTLVIGGTGSGKTTSYIHNVLMNLISDKQKPSIVVYDEKSTLSKMIKHFMDNNFYDIYEFSIIKVHEQSISINLLSYFNNNKDLRLLFDSICKVEEASGDHKYWARSASALLFDTTNILLAFQKICDFGSILTEEDIHYKSNIIIDNKKAIKKSIFLTKTPVTLKLIGEYIIENRGHFKAIAENSIDILDNLKIKIVKSLPSNIKYKDALELDKLFDTAYKYAKKMTSYSISYKDSTGSGINGIFMSAASLLNETRLCDIDTLNDIDNAQDLIELLECTRKILIIDSDSFPLSATTVITKILFDRLSMRMRQQFKRPIHILIDEAARICVSKEIELGKTMSIARESQLFLHLCFQSEAQLENLGESEYRIIMENSSNILKFSTYEEPLETHYYRYNGEGQILYAKPLFVDQCSLFNAEAKYQKTMNAYQELNYSNQEVVIFDNKRFEKNKTVYIINYINNNERIVHYEPFKVIQLNYFRKIFQKMKDRNDLNSSVLYDKYLIEDSKMLQEYLEVF